MTDSMPPWGAGIPREALGQLLGLSDAQLDRLLEQCRGDWLRLPSGNLRLLSIASVVNEASRLRDLGRVQTRAH